MCIYDVYTLNRTVDNSRERFGDKTAFTLGIRGVYSKMQLCIGSVLTDCMRCQSY